MTRGPTLRMSDRPGAAGCGPSRGAVSAPGRPPGRSLNNRARSLDVRAAAVSPERSSNSLMSRRPALKCSLRALCARSRSVVPIRTSGWSVTLQDSAATARRHRTGKAVPSLHAARAESRRDEGSPLNDPPTTQDRMRAGGRRHRYGLLAATGALPGSWSTPGASPMTYERLLGTLLWAGSGRCLLLRGWDHLLCSAIEGDVGERQQDDQCDRRIRR